MSMHTIDIARDFSKYPAGRFLSDGPFSGEAFREDVLVPALRSADLVVVILNGAAGYGSSFLEEAFGGLVRKSGFAKGILKNKLKLEGDDENEVQEILGYIKDARKET